MLSLIFANLDVILRGQAWKSEKADHEREMNQEVRAGYEGDGRGRNSGGIDEEGEKAQPTTVPAQGKGERPDLFDWGAGYGCQLFFLASIFCLGGEEYHLAGVFFTLVYPL